MTTLYRTSEVEALDLNRPVKLVVWFSFSTQTRTK
jgi:hypothetical protein